MSREHRQATVAQPYPLMVWACLVVVGGAALSGMAANKARVQSPRAAASEPVNVQPAVAFPAAPVATASIGRSIAPPKPLWLRWDAAPGITNWIVYVGAARNKWTNHFKTTTNTIVIDRTAVYGVASLSGNLQNMIAYWPSNRLGQLWLIGMSNDLSQRTNVVQLTGTFTNNPPGNMQLWGVENRTVGYQ
jgi:hypothetical protein